MLEPLRRPPRQVWKVWRDSASWSFRKWNSIRFQGANYQRQHDREVQRLWLEPYGELVGCGLAARKASVLSVRLHQVRRDFGRREGLEEGWKKRFLVVYWLGQWTVRKSVAANVALDDVPLLGELR